VISDFLFEERDISLIGERPTMRQEFVELGDGIVGDARQHVAKPGKRVDFDQFAGGYETA
jgi:hypothetical protein